MLLESYSNLMILARNLATGRGRGRVGLAVVVAAAAYCASRQHLSSPSASPVVDGQNGAVKSSKQYAPDAL